MTNKEFDDRYYELGGMYFTNDTDKRFAEFIVNARNSRTRVEVIYNDGWENFSGYHGGNGLRHSFYVGKSMGIRPVALVISSKRSYGGSQLLSCSKAIKSYRVK
jgi:hypothetical protein